MMMTGCGNAALVAGGGEGPTSSVLGTTAKAEGPEMFYGVNGHMAWGTGIYKRMTPAEQLAILLDLGVGNYRCDVADHGMAAYLAKALTGPFAGSGVAILPVINPRSAGWNPYGTEA